MPLLGKHPASLGHVGLQKALTSHVNRAALSLGRSLQLYLHYALKVLSARAARISHSATAATITLKESEISLEVQCPPLLFTKYHKQLHYGLLT